jgi:hypothetical protein
MIVAAAEALIEDLGSSNGTFLNSVDVRVTRFTPLSRSDTVYFGSLAVPAAQLLAGLLAPAVPAAAHSLPPQRSERPSPPVVPLAARTVLERNRWLMFAVAQALALALLILLISGRQAGARVTGANWVIVWQAIAATVSALSVAALWLGCSVAVAALASGLWPAHHPPSDAKPLPVTIASRLAVLIAACAGGCVLLLAIVYWGAALKGSGLAIWGLLALASTIGLLLGLVLSIVVKNWHAVAAALLGFVALFIALGGWLWPLSGQSSLMTVATAVSPVRWAFEGILLLELPAQTLPAEAVETDRDSADAFFPADSVRMGPGADATALVFMVVGLAAIIAFAATRSG